MKIYIAGPITADNEITLHRNVRRAMDVAIELMHRGHEVHCPHLTYFLALRAAEREKDIDYEVWMTHGISLINKWADALYFLGPSPGANRELRQALKLRKKIFRSLEEVGK